MTLDFRDHLLEICLSQHCMDEHDDKKEDRCRQSVREPVACEKVDQSTDHAGHENRGFDQEQFSSGRPRDLIRAIGGAYFIASSSRRSGAGRYRSP